MSTRFIEAEDGRRISYIRTDVPNPKQHVVMVHGIFGEKTEDGRFSRLTEKLAHDGLASSSFDYSGHGEHSFPPERFTIANALTDYVEYMDNLTDGLGEVKLSIVASSFGASLTLLYLRLRECRVPEKLVLLNPVTDYMATFLEPMEPVLREERFNAEWVQEIRSKGKRTYTDDFTVSLPLLLEFELYRPFETFETLMIPTLVMHGDCDSVVPYMVSKTHALRSRSVTFHTISGADHAFVEEKHEDVTHELTRKFLSA